MKKVIALLTTGGLFLLMVSPVMACGDWYCWMKMKCKYCRDRNYAEVTNRSDAYADTGGNMQGNTAEVLHAGNSNAKVKTSGDMEIDTGDATATTETKVMANSVGSSTRGRRGRKASLQTNVATVKNTSIANALTGYNAQSNYAQVNHASNSNARIKVKDGGMNTDTGEAVARTQTWSLVNFSMRR